MPEILADGSSVFDRRHGVSLEGCSDHGRGCEGDTELSRVASDFVDVRPSGIIAMKLYNGEAIVDVQICTEKDDVLLTVGGTIPGDDIPELKRLGVAEVFTPGAPTQDIIDFIQGAVAERDRS